MYRFHSKFLVAAATAALFWAGCKKDDGPIAPTATSFPPATTAGLVDKWNGVATQAVMNLGAPPVGPAPFVEARIYAMTFVAMHDALNSIFRRYRPYALDTIATQALPDVAVAAAAHDVLINLIPSQAPFVDSVYAAVISVYDDDYPYPAQGVMSGIALGKRAATSILARRSADGSDHAQGPYTAGTAPGAYRPTPPFDGPPFNGFVDSPFWGNVTPFVLTSSSQFLPPPPYAITSDDYADDLNEVKTLGSATSTSRTTDQTEVALFWAENSPLGWNRIARTAAAARNLDNWDRARLYALLQLAEMDGYLACLEAKYTYNFWRPITAVRLAETDGNPYTSGDPSWTPLVVTPPAPDYPSAHATAGGAGAEVLASFFGTDNFSFTATSTSLPGKSRTFTSFSQACNENGLSRIYIGFHFRLAVDRGIEHGRAIGSYIMHNALQTAQ